MNKKTTPLYQQHGRLKAKMIDFAGWQMPLAYTSQIKEHQAVRQHVGMFDVSHMTIIDVNGKQAEAYLRYLLANDVAKLKINQALYSCMLNLQAGVLDDLIIYRLATAHYRLILNALTREKDIAWIERCAANFQVTLTAPQHYATIAVQGPQAISTVQRQVSSQTAKAITQLKPFSFHLERDYLFARTGYTGEDGLEIILPAEHAAALWQDLEQLGVQPCGLGARDSLRLEAGLNLYGQDMDERVNPLESGLAWTVDWSDRQRDFIGRRALEIARQHSIKRKLIGLILQTRGVLRAHQKVILPDGECGEITSGVFSPTLKQSIAFARVPANIARQCLVEIRSKCLPAKIVKPPFVRKGKPIFQPA